MMREKKLAHMKERRRNWTLDQLSRVSEGDRGIEITDDKKWIQQCEIEPNSW